MVCRRRFSFLIAAVLLPSLPRITAEADQTPANDPREAEIRKFLSDFIQSFNNLDWEKFRNYFDDQATVIHPALFARRLDGRIEFEKAWLAVFEQIRTESGKSARPYMHLEPKDIETQTLGEVAVVTFHLERSATSIGRRTLVLRKTPAGWKVVHLHASNVDLAAAK